ncbi:hypothetical protein BX070DRAFT_226767 [Coemansia spiralis]|nr:hypothetical protein BX070DRAFT_226767 [Coemansia spiralis]
MQLVDKYGKKREKVAEEMSTDRSPNQCQMLYRHRFKAIQHREYAWSEEKSLRLELFVEFFIHYKLLPRSEQGSVASDLQPCKTFPYLVPDKLVLVDVLKW